MSVRRTVVVACTMLLTVGLLFMPAGYAGAQDKTAAPPSPAAPQGKPTIAKICSNCHQPQEGSLRGNFDSVAYKTQSIQIKIDEVTEIIRFDKTTLKTQNIQAPADSPDEPLHALKKGKEIRIEYTEKDGKKLATLVSAKPAIKVAPEKLM